MAKTPQRLDIPIVDGRSIGKCGNGAIDADFAQQMQIVLDRHLIRLKARSIAVERVSRASISINTALAAASAGDYSRLMSAMYDMLRLGPTGLHRYFRDSRILERVTSRLRAKLGGAF